jgi:uncharacterized protein (DUF1015 family)
MLIRPFSGMVVRPDLAAQLVTPAFDVLDEDARQRLLDEQPMSYMHVITAEEDDAGDEEGHVRLTRSARALSDLLEAEAFVALDRPATVAYRVTSDGRAHDGLLAEVAVKEHEAGRVRPHEQVRPRKVARFAGHLRAVGATSTPALLVHPPSEGLRQVFDRVASGPPHVDVTAPDGSRHTIWVEEGSEPETVEHLDAIPHLYVADGHHRIEAAAQVAGSESGFFLAHLVPPAGVDLLPYHRVVKGVRSADRERARADLVARFDTEEVGAAPAEAARPRGESEVAVCLGGVWLRVRIGTRTSADPIAGLDAVTLQDEVLAPVFGIDDPTTDDRLEFVRDDPRLAAVERRVSDPEVVAFVLHPPTVDAVMAVADAGQVLPPKSTWFRPKLPSGLVLHPLDAAAEAEDVR